MTDEVKDIQVVIETRVREVAGNYRLSEAFLKAFNTKVIEVIHAAAARAENNGRKTLQPHDL